MLQRHEASADPTYMDKPFRGKRLAWPPAAVEDGLRLALRQCIKNLLYKSQRPRPTSRLPVLANQESHGGDAAASADQHLSPLGVHRFWRKGVDRPGVQIKRC